VKLLVVSVELIVIRFKNPLIARMVLVVNVEFVVMVLNVAVVVASVLIAP